MLGNIKPGVRKISFEVVVSLFSSNGVITRNPGNRLIFVDLACICRMRKGPQVQGSAGSRLRRVWAGDSD